MTPEQQVKFLKKGMIGGVIIEVLLIIALILSLTRPMCVMP